MKVCSDCGRIPDYWKLDSQVLSAVFTEDKYPTVRSYSSFFTTSLIIVLLDKSRCYTCFISFVHNCEWSPNLSYLLRRGENTITVRTFVLRIHLRTPRLQLYSQSMGWLISLVSVYGHAQFPHPPSGMSCTSGQRFYPLMKSACPSLCWWILYWLCKMIFIKRDVNRSWWRISTSSLTTSWRISSKAGMELADAHCMHHFIGYQT